MNNTVDLAAFDFLGPAYQGAAPVLPGGVPSMDATTVDPSDIGPANRAMPQSGIIVGITDAVGNVVSSVVAKIKQGTLSVWDFLGTIGGWLKWGLLGVIVLVVVFFVFNLLRLFS